MIPVLSTAESSRLDAEASDRIDELMSAAGWAVASAAIELGAGYGTRVAVLAGPGNNGGDGWVAAARLQRRGVRVTAHQLAEPKTAVASRARDRALDAGVEVASVQDRPSRMPDMIVDAVFGAGLRSGMPAELVPWVESDATVVAAHVPSGLDPDTGVADEHCFRAATTVAFHAPSPGHVLGDGPDVCGKVVVADIGLDGGRPLFTIAQPADAPRPARDRRTHKWSAGSVLVVGGSSGMIGAAVMAARSALHFGAGSVGLAVPDQQLEAVALLAPEILAYPQSALPERFDVVVAGPGMGDRREAVAAVLDHEGLVVLDADGIDAAGVDAVTARSAPTVLTPHAGEFERFAGTDADREAAGELAADIGAVVLLKGNPTFVTDGGTPVAITSNGPELATIGTGDVLAGLVGSLAARGLDPMTAAVSAAHWHGVAAADLARITTVTADRLARHVGRFAGVV